MTKRRRDKPIEIWYRYVGQLPFPEWREWRRWKRYRDLATATTTRDQLERKDIFRSWEYEIR